MISNVQNVSSLSMTRGLGKVATETVDTALQANPGAAVALSQGASFASVMSNMATDMVNNLKGAESASFAGIKGTASTREVVDAVMQAEQSLQTAISLRDKIVSAYLDVTKMQI
ncbi:flagellar hook-basal body complex protein FliE [Rhizobium sp. BK251]|uniref:flagellar hook-basal body complex protein FliE n=1 Tax=Rhizobium sp. BK251 TaxID=2512125 RepID=UPI00104B58F7|nr:flagellar hook-basal body complex protein FliE [Rhizobium sp. BK251]TCL75610.1 flagellar hook-basal body complex protein FliE [Rhizobium sp. BK251]